MEPRRKFRFLKELAQGGFGKVYLAEMVTGDHFSSVVAIKLLHGRWLSNDEIVMRSRDEARLLGRLRHRNIVRVEDLTAINGQCAIVMEYLQGVDMKTTCTFLKERGKVFPRKALFESLAAIAAALDAAYNHVPLQGGAPLNVIHRDIKPSNAMITVEGDVKVLDFGTARASFEEREAKTQVLAFGSQAYMAPERMLGEPDTPAADVFSLGVSLYEMLVLDAFGKIHLRQERYEPAMAERVDAISAEVLAPALRDDVLSTLRAMLAYESTARPSAAQVVDLMEALADRAGDTGLKRFSRETVRQVMELQAPVQDPNDPYNGASFFEDVSGINEGGHGQTEAFGAEPPSDGDEFRPPPELAEAAIDLPSSRPAAGAAAPARHHAPPPPPKVQSALPTMAPSATATPAYSRTLDPPGAISDVSRRGPPPADSGPTLRTDPSEAFGDPPGARGAGVGLVLGVALLGLLGAALAGGALVLFNEAGDRDAPAPPVAAAPALPAGSEVMDWTPNNPGKGGVILEVPGGATEVYVSSSRGFRAEWDGSKYLRLKDLEAGTFRGKVKPRSRDGSVLADFAVEAGKTCAYAFRPNGTWEKGECR